MHYMWCQMKYQSEPDQVTHEMAASMESVLVTQKESGSDWRRTLANLFFACAVVIGQVTQNVSLPLWVDSTANMFSANVTHPPTMDSYFVLSFASLSFVVIFGCAFFSVRVFCSVERPEAPVDTAYLILLAKVGFLCATGALFLVFSSSGSRTPPYLQAILGSFSIPVTLLFRFVLLKKIPTRRKLISAMAIVFGLLVCLVPTIITKLDSGGTKNLGGAKGVGRVLWPFCFMAAFGIAALGAITEEKAVKLSHRESNIQTSLVTVMFWISVFQFLTILMYFWADILPGFGHAENLHDFKRNWWFALQCVFGGAGCSASPGLSAFLFILGYVATVSASALLLRYAEGATYLAIVSSLSAPLGFIFWTLFQESPFHWKPQVRNSTWFSIGALVVMVPATFIYNTGPPEISNEAVTKYVPTAEDKPLIR